MDDIFQKIVDKINDKKKTKIELTGDAKKLFDAFSKENKSTKQPIKNKIINKENYGFEVALIDKDIPIKKDTSNLLDYDMKKFFYIDLVVNDGKECCLMTISKFNTIDDAEVEYNNWINFINNNDIVTILSKINNLI